MAELFIIFVLAFLAYTLLTYTLLAYTLLAYTLRRRHIIMILK